MAVKLAVSFLTNALSALSWKESASYTHDIHHVAVGPGLTLHLMLVNREYEGRGPIKSKKVFQNFIIYELNFSATKAAGQADVLYFPSRMDAVMETGATLKAIQDVLLKLITGPEFAADPSNGRLRLSVYQGLIDQLSAAQKNAYDELKKLVEWKRSADHTAIS